MNEKPGLEPGFFCSTSCWRLDGLSVAPGAEHMLGRVPLRGWFSEGLETSDLLEAGTLLCVLIVSTRTAMTARSDVLLITDKTKLLKSALGQTEVAALRRDVCFAPAVSTGRCNTLS